MTFVLRSLAFDRDGPIPKSFTGEGEDVSPPLEWAEAPEGTKEFALLVDDPDAPRPRPWVHWVLYRIPAERTALPEGSNGGGVEGMNDFGHKGYGGPLPPPGHGVHHYRFQLYALSEPLSLAPGASREDLLEAIGGRVLGQAELVGTYER